MGYRKINLTYIAYASLVYAIGLGCFVYGSYFYYLDLYEWVILGLFFLWIVVAFGFVKFSKVNGFSSWWIWFSLIFFVHPVEIIAMIAIWFFGGFSG